jgi:hypothetical protein
MTQGNVGKAQGEAGKPDTVLDPAEEELYAGAKIDSADEAIASDEAVQEAAAAGATVLPPDMKVPDTVYTIDMWHVQTGQNAAFVEAWHNLMRRFQQLPQRPAGKRVLVQSAADPDLYYSIEPWQSAADIEAIRPDAEVQAALAELRRFCTESQVGAYVTVAVEE